MEEERSAPASAVAAATVPAAPVVPANNAEATVVVGEKCDVCGGDDKEIRSTAGTVSMPSGGGAPLAEKMVRCSVCGHAAHPTCLGFTATMRHSVVGYRWQYASLLHFLLLRAASPSRLSFKHTDTSQ